LEVESDLPEVDLTEEQRQEMEHQRRLKYSHGKKAPSETEQQRREKYSHGKKEPYVPSLLCAVLCCGYIVRASDQILMLCLCVQTGTVVRTPTPKTYARFSQRKRWHGDLALRRCNERRRGGVA
jgi:hypothetical protein